LFLKRHIPWDTNNGIDNFFYAYCIRISSNNITNNQKYQLLSRKWIITDNSKPNKPEIVKGKGVVGYYPIIYEKCDDFTY
jgi:uncharacterized protein affecting Mg2+/Co2+ transport